MFCECGCGAVTKKSPSTVHRLGYVKDKHRRYVLGHNQRIPLSERFWAKVRPAGALECWEWTGGRNKGYGQVRLDGRIHRAHRVAWTLLRGEIPDNLTIEHECRNPSCVNPWHMDLWPLSKNSAGAINQNVNRTHCKRGHEFTLENTALKSPQAEGRAARRKCRECARLDMRARRARDKQPA